MIELSRVTKTYELGGEKIYALRDVSIKIPRGAFVAIMGPSGSGKSTFANIVGGLDTPDSGTVTIDGVDISRATDYVISEYRNKKIGFIFQSFNLQPTFTALENVSIPLMFARVPPQLRVKRASECLKAVGLSDRMHHLPTQLSGGQRQRVCIARALANNPEVIIADEPTGNLDSKKGQEIVDLLIGLNKSGITILIITHDPQVGKQAKQLLTMKDGQIHL